MQVSQKLLIYNQFNKSVFRIFRDRSTVAATVCPYANQQDANEFEVRPKAEVSTKNYLPYSEVPGPKPIPILGNTWRSVTNG